jgi:hypothetical protein
VQSLIDEQGQENSQRDEVRTKIEVAEGEIDAGEYFEYDENTVHELAKDVHKRGLKRLAAEGGKTGTRG